MGIVLHMAAHANVEGYAISSQNYFSELSKFTGETIDPVTHQAVSLARGKLDWQAFQYLLGKANQDTQLSDPRYRYHGHITRAIDGTSITLPRSEELLEYFDPRTSKVGVAHYPAALLVTALNVFTGQCKSARVANHFDSERDQLRSMIDLDFSAGDLALLDRGFCGDQTYLCFEQHQQHYVCRARAEGEYTALWIQNFLRSGKKDISVWRELTDVRTGKTTSVKIRLLRGPAEHPDERMVLVTNLTDSHKYSRKSLLKLYRSRWEVETMYGRVKNLLKLESFHAKNVNGVLQEIFANLLVISLTAMVALAAACELKLDPDIAVPSFKNARAVVKRHLLDAVQSPDPLTPKKARRLAKELIREASRVIWKKQPGRSYPRVSQQPIKFWPLAKTKKVKDFKNARSKP